MAEMKVVEPSDEGTLEYYRANNVARLAQDPHRVASFTKSCTSWSEDELAAWVDSIGTQYELAWGGIPDKLLEAGVDGAMIMQMREEDWKDCDIEPEVYNRIMDELLERRLITSRMEYEYLTKWEFSFQEAIRDEKIDRADPYAKNHHKLFKEEFQRRQTEEEGDDAPEPPDYWYQQETFLPKVTAFLRDWVPRVMRESNDTPFGLMACKIQNWTQIRSGFSNSTARKGFASMLAQLDTVLHQAYPKAFEGTYLIGMNYFYLTWISHDQHSLKDFANHIIDWARSGLQYNRYMYVEHAVLLNIGVATTNQAAEENVFQTWVRAAENALVYSCTKRGVALGTMDIEDDKNAAQRKSAMLYRVLNRSQNKRDKIATHMSNLIISNSCDLSYQDPDSGETLLMLAAKWGLSDAFDPRLELARYVINPDISDKNDNTLLHLAVKNRRGNGPDFLSDEAFRYIMLFAESNRTCKNKAGKTPIELADGDELLLQLLDEDMGAVDDEKVSEILPQNLEPRFGSAADELGSDFSDDENYQGQNLLDVDADMGYDLSDFSGSPTDLYATDPESTLHSASGLSLGAINEIPESPVGE